MSKFVDPLLPNKRFLCCNTLMDACEMYYISISFPPKVPELSSCAGQGPQAITFYFMLKVLSFQDCLKFLRQALDMLSFYETFFPQKSMITLSIWAHAINHTKQEYKHRSLLINFVSIPFTWKYIKFISFVTSGSRTSTVFS